MASLQPVRGTTDLLPEAARKHRAVEALFAKVAELYGYGEIATPIFEFTEVFKRTLGDTSDIVTKEMYTFADRNDESITLRPEGTAGVVRAFISNGLAQSVPLKLFYKGPMFRYERPQKGRQRQFHQVGVELLGVESSQADVEVLSMAARFLEELGLKDHVTLELNSLGDSDSRDAYRRALVAYMTEHKDALSEDSRMRLDRNPLRILDSKDEADREIIAGAPKLSDHLNDYSAKTFEWLLRGLDALGIAYTVNPYLVRGLDYYCHTAFEFTTTKLGAQGTVLAGGRYDGLIPMMGGPKTHGIGWAAGVERLAMLYDRDTSAPRPIAIVPIGSVETEEHIHHKAFNIAEDLRRAGYVVDVGYSGNVGKRMKRANKIDARAAVMLGTDELDKGVATVRDLDSGEQSEVAIDALASMLVGFKG